MFDFKLREYLTKFNLCEAELLFCLNSIKADKYNQKLKKIFVYDMFKCKISLVNEHAKFIGILSEARRWWRQDTRKKYNKIIVEITIASCLFNEQESSSVPLYVCYLTIFVHPFVFIFHSFEVIFQYLLIYSFSAKPNIN